MMVSMIIWQRSLLTFFLSALIGYIDCTPLPSIIESGKDTKVISGLDELQQLRTSIERMRLQAQGFESSLHTMKPYQMVRLTSAQLQHGSQNDLIALQHALLTYAHSTCLRPDIASACLRYDGFPTYAHEQAYKSITLLYLLRSLPLAEADGFVEGFLETATESDIAALKRVLTFSRNSRIHQIFGDKLQGNSGIIGRHMKRDNSGMHIHLHGVYPPD
ncbi:uncharacterized protein FA14DRAFT_3298 [Meira miltonrushii]|uniref:Uncharacterized protein n=1 Tax=Meira miltonrushii TaxID=1280837 RepID=A0A316VHJ2_9BASI|nr:uncharacterized protein FA14DRAFT_3298 [Meira miltonrushii]PWN36498.1 hypothetical protein FA14DRAFT_3298 [Meira miltonrushii]